MSWMTDPTGSFQVAVPGEFGPVFRTAFAEAGADRAGLSSVFTVSVPDGQGIHEIAAMLQARGLMILGIRPVTAPSDHSDGSG
jgi:hypothetical protein